jgi:hypothetical protein
MVISPLSSAVIHHRLERTPDAGHFLTSPDGQALRRIEVSGAATSIRAKAAINRRSPKLQKSN